MGGLAGFDEPVQTAVRKDGEAITRLVGALLREQNDEWLSAGYRPISS